MDPRYARSSSWIVKVRQRRTDVEFNRQILAVLFRRRSLSLEMDCLVYYLFCNDARCVPNSGLSAQTRAVTATVSRSRNRESCLCFAK